MEKLSSTKPVPGAQKVGDHWASELTQITRNVKISYTLLRPLLNLYRKNSKNLQNIYIT